MEKELTYSNLKLWLMILVGVTVVLGVAMVLMIFASITKEVSLSLIATIIFGIIVAPAAAIVCNLVSSLILLKDKEEKLKSEEENLKKTLYDILLKDKNDASISLFVLNKSKLTKIHFYDNFYKEANEINICGIALFNVIKYICQENHDSESWVKNLESQENVKVRILMLSPQSEYIEILEKQEEVKKHIKKSLNLLKTFCNKNKKKKLASNTTLTVKTTRKIMDCNIAYAGLDNDSKLLLGFAFHDQSGPLCNIGRNSDTHKQCINYFKAFYEEGETLFTWNENGVIM